MSADQYEGPVVLPDDVSFGPEVQVDYPGYRSTQWRAPKRPLVTLPEELHALDGPVFGEGDLASAPTATSRASTTASRSASASSCTAACSTRTVGRSAARSSRCGRRTPAAATATTSTSIPAPLDPNFSGAGRCLTDDEGRYRFVTVKPGAYPWGNHENAWRPAHIHFSLFGRLFTQRLVTQMYFPGDPLFPYDPIFNSVRDPHSRELLVARFDLAQTQPEWALAYEWDVVLGRGGRGATPLEDR